MGHDLRLRSIGLIRRLRRFGQHLLHLQVGLRIFLHPVGAVQGFFLSESRERLSRLALLLCLVPTLPCVRKPMFLSTRNKASTK